MENARAGTLYWIRFWLLVFIAGLMASGATALVIVKVVNLPYRALHYFGISDGAVHDWLQAVLAALLDTKVRYPFLFYALDWLAFGHFVIALAFLGALRDPVRNRWIVQMGMIACLLVLPWAALFGMMRGVVWWWQLVDASFGIFGIVPLLLAWRGIRRLESAA